MSLPGPRRLFAVTARAEMFTWAGLLIAMGLKYGGVTERMVPIAGGVHGFVFLCYLVVTVAVWIDGRWPVARGLGSTIVPFMTIPFERAQRRRGEPASRWQVVDRAPGERGPLERLLVVVLRHPVVSALLAVAVVAVVFTLLLNAGPPTEWGR